MTGHRTSAWRHDCQGPKGCFIAGLPSWDELVSCFPGKVAPSDIDGMVEINANFLFIEQKGAGVPFSGDNGGQFRALKVLAELPDVTVLFIRPGVRSDYEFLLLDGTPGPVVRECSKGQLHGWLRNWSQKARASRGDAA